MLQRTRVEKLYTLRYTLMCTIVDECKRQYAGVFPSYSEFASDPQVQPVLADIAPNNLSYEKLCEVILPQVAAIRDRWEHQIRSSIAPRICTVTRCNYARDPTRLAIGALMRCSSCNLILEYPGLLSHQCSSAYDGKSPYLYTLGFLVAFRYAIWDYRFTEVLRHVIATCGADPATAEVDALDAACTRLYCTHCARRMPGVMTVLSWREAVSRTHRIYRVRQYLTGSYQVAHAYTTHKDEKIDFTLEGITWGRVPQAQCQQALPLESSAITQLTQKRVMSKLWHCGLCSNWEPDTQLFTEAHLLSE